MSRPRRFDLYPDDFLAGIAGKLDPAEVGVYLVVLLLIYSHTEPIDDDPAMVARVFRTATRKSINKVLDRLVALGKLSRESGHIVSKRASHEIMKAVERQNQAIMNGKLGGRPSGKSTGYENPEVSETGKLPAPKPVPSSTNHLKEDEKNGFHGSDTRSQIKPTPEERAWRKGRWEQNTMNHIRCTMQAPQAEAVIAGYLNGDPRAVAAFEAASADLKRRKANATH